MDVDISNMQTLLGFSDYKMLMLRLNQIFTAQDFIDHSTEELGLFLHMSTFAIQALKFRFTSYFAQESGAVIFKNCRLRGEVFQTGIKPFDDLFETKGIFSSDIVEIIGPPASGKSMLIYTVIINVMVQAEEGLKIIFIDTKGDFRAMKLKRMMDARGLSELKQRSVLESITVYKANTPQQLLVDLELIRCRPRSLSDVKMVFIDSITIPFYLFLNEFEKSFFSIGIMSDVVQSLKLISERHIAIIITNLSLYQREITKLSNISSSAGDEETESISQVEVSSMMPAVYPALGKLWETVSQHKVLMNFTKHPYLLANDMEKAERHISLFYSKVAKETEALCVEITDTGII